MGKDLHYSIRPFIERAIRNHKLVLELKELKDDEYYAYLIKRKNRLRDVVLVLSDAYHVDFPSPDNSLLKKGGFFLIARPEADDYYDSDPENMIITGKLAILLGSLNKDRFWEYEQPSEKRDRSR